MRYMIFLKKFLVAQVMGKLLELNPSGQRTREDTRRRVFPSLPVARHASPPISQATTENGKSNPRERKRKGEFCDCADCRSQKGRAKSIRPGSRLRKLHRRCPHRGEHRCGWPRMADVCCPDRATAEGVFTTLGTTFHDLHLTCNHTDTFMKGQSALATPDLIRQNAFQDSGESADGRSMPRITVGLSWRQFPRHTGTPVPGIRINSIFALCAERMILHGFMPRIATTQKNGRETCLTIMKSC